MLSSAHYWRFGTDIFLNGSIVTGFTGVPTFFKSRHQVVQDRVDSPMCQKSSPLVKPGVFIASLVICDRERWKITLEWSLLTLLRTFVGTVTYFFTRCLRIVLDISNVDLPFENSDVKTNFSSAAKSHLWPIIARFWSHPLITRKSKASYQWWKCLLVVFTYLKPESFYTARIYNCCHQSLLNFSV